MTSLPLPIGGRLLPPWDRRRRTLVAVVIGFVVLTVLSLQITDISLSTLLEGFEAAASNDATRTPPSLLRRMLAMPAGRDLWNPVHVLASLWAILLGQATPDGGISFSLIMNKTLETVWIALLGTAMAATLSVPIGVAAAANTTPGRGVQFVARSIIAATRAIPDLVFALIFVRAIGIGVLPGVLAIGLHAIGMLGKLFADAIEEIDEDVRLSVEATGASRLQVLFSAVLPQVVPSFVSVTLYRLDINFRTSTLLGFVGAGGIGQLLNATFNNLRYQEALRIVLVIMVFVVIVELISSAMRRSLVGAEDDAGGAATRTLLHGARRLRGLVPGIERPVAGRAIEDGASSRLPVGKRVLPPWTPLRRQRAAYWSLLGALLLVSLVTVDIRPWDPVVALARDIPFNRNARGELFILAFVPDFATAIRVGALGKIVETVAIGLVGTFFGLLLAVPLGFLAARNVAPNPRVAAVVRYFLVVERSIPELVYALIFIAAVGLGPFPGVMALVFLTIGFVAKLIADALEQIADGPREGIAATGANRMQERISGVLPQIVPSLIGNSLYMLDVNIRASTVLGIVGGGGIGFLLFNSTKVLAFEVTSAILVMIFVVVIAIERLSGWVRQQLI